MANEYNHRILEVQLTAFTVLFRMTTILYIQFYVSTAKLDLWEQSDKNKTIFLLEWLLVEVVGFYIYVISGSIYLALASFKGNS